MCLRTVKEGFQLSPAPTLTFADPFLLTSECGRVQLRLSHLLLTQGGLMALGCQYLLPPTPTSASARLSPVCLPACSSSQAPRWAVPSLPSLSNVPSLTNAGTTRPPPRPLGPYILILANTFSMMQPPPSAAQLATLTQLGLLLLIVCPASFTERCKARGFPEEGGNRKPAEDRDGGLAAS